MKTDSAIIRFPGERWPLVGVIVTTLVAVAVMIYHPGSGPPVIFRNLFYFPVIIACVYYLKKGFAFSVGLSFLYFVFVFTHTNDFIIIAEALVMTVIFILIAGVVTFISLRYRQTSEASLREKEIAQDALRLSEEKYRLAFVNVTDVVYSLDTDFRVLMVSPSVERILGYKEEELVGKLFSDLNLLTPESMQKAASDVERVFSGEVIGTSIYEFIAKDKTRKFGEVSGSPLYRDGKIAGLFSVARDITQRRKAEDALRLSEEKYKLTFTHVTDVVYTLDKNLRFLTVSPSAEKLVGYKPDELTGKRFTDFNFLPPESLQQAASDAEKAFSGEIVTGSIYEFVARDNTRKFGEVNSSPLYQNGKIVGLISVVRDITERKQAQANLIREKKQLSHLLNLRQRSDTQTEDIESFVVEESIRMTDSRLGFFGFINGDETVMTAHLWSEEAMKGCRVDFKTVEFSLGHAGIWAEAVREHKPLIINDYLSPDPRKKGYPEGHVPIERLMSIPLIKNAKAVAIIALANKAQNYDEKDLLHVSLLLENVWDILQQKKAEKALIRREAYFRSLIEKSSDMITILDANGIILYESESVKRVLGYEPSELIGRSVFDFAHPDDAHEIRATFGRAVAKIGNPDSGILRYLHKDGSWRYLESVDKNLLDDDEVRGLVVNSHDVTARVEAEEALRKSEARLNTLVHNIPDLVWLKDFDGLYLACNPAFERFFGATEAEIAGKTDYDFVDQELADFFRENDCRAMEAGAPTVNEEWITFASDGHRALLETIKTPMYDSGGMLIGVLGIGRDITERKQMEEALRERNKEINTLYSISGVIEKTENMEEALKLCTDYIAKGFYYPEYASARISIGGQEFKTDNFQETPWKLSIDIMLYGKPVGSVDVCYVKEMPRRDEGPFLKEERILLNSIAQRFSRYVERNKYEMDREVLISELQTALSEIKQLGGLLPICSSCKKIRNDAGYWEQIEGYIREHTDVEFSHGICPDCAAKYAPGDDGIPRGRMVMKKMTVLLVDDEEDFRFLFIRQIRRIAANYEIEFVEARDAGEALKLLRAGVRPSVMIVDYILDRDNGIELFWQIDANHPALYDIPRILISGYRRDQIEKESQSLRFVFFEKGTDMAEFCEQIWNHITSLTALPDVKK